MAAPTLLAPATRRGMHRVAAAGLAAAAMQPLLADKATAAPLATNALGARERRRFHRCKVHRKHTCYRARTCKHRRHKPPREVPPSTPQSPPPPDPSLLP